MGRLLRLDLRRAIKDKSVIVIFAITAAFAIAQVLLGILMKITAGPVTLYLVTARSIIQASFSFSSMPFLLIVILIAVFVGKDLNFGTIRNKIIAGYSKKQIYFAHLLISLIMATAAMLLYQAIVYVTGIGLITFPTTNLNDFFIRLGLGYLVVWTAISITVFIEMMSKSMVTAIIVSVILFLFLPLISGGLSIYFTADAFVRGVTDVRSPILEYFYFYQAYAIPNGNVVAVILGEPDSQLSAAFIWKTLGVNLVMLGGLNYLGMYLFPKTDLK